jgi:YD repeat-containing protein
VSDRAGRPVERTASDGTVSRIEYDRQIPAGARLPIGLPTLEIVTTPDGLVCETSHTLNDERTAVVASETRSGAPDALTLTGRTEQQVRADGFVTEQRTYPGGDVQAAPVVVTRSEHTDPTLGTSTVTETRPAPRGAVGMDGPIATTTTVSTTSLLHGGVIEETDVTGRTSRATHDELGRLVSATDQMGRTVTTVYETTQRDGRNATVVSMPGGVVATEVRDELGRVIRVADNIRDGVATPGFERVSEIREHPSPGVERVTDAWGATTETTSDAFGRVVRVESPTGLVHVTDYDDVAGTVTTGTTPTGRIADAELITTKRTDEAERTKTTAVTRADGVETPGVTSRVDGFDRPVFADDGTVVTRVTYDSSGNPVKTTYTPAGSGEPVTIERRFDAFGTSLEKLVRDGSETRSGGSRTTDALGRVAGETDQRGASATVVTSTIDGLPLRSVASTGAVTTRVYDEDTRALVRTTAESPVGATVSTEIEHDEETGRVRAVLDPADPDGSRIEYEHDDAGNLLQTRYPDGAVVTNAYDPHGRLESTSDVTGRVTVLGYDHAGRLAEAVQHDGAADAPVLARAAYRYDAFDRVDRLERGNGVVTEYTFTSASEVASETTTRGGEVLAERAYEYDATGRMTSRVDRAPDESDTTTTYDYDARDRLIRSRVERDGTERSTEYRLGLAGDVDAMTERGDDPVRREFAYSPVGELVSITTDGVASTQEYDVAGNLVVAADGAVSTYDGANRMVSRTTPGGATTTTSYWADGTRRELTETAPDGSMVSTTFHWDDGELVNETHTGAGSSATVSYLLGADRHARTVTADRQDAVPVTRYADADRHGNVTGLTDETGTPVTR